MVNCAIIRFDFADLIPTHILLFVFFDQLNYIFALHLIEKQTCGVDQFQCVPFNRIVAGSDGNAAAGF